MKTVERLSVKVIDVRYPPMADQKSDWFKILTDKGPVSGNMAWRPEPGEMLIISGSWGAYKGQREFKFKNAMPNVPVDPKAQLKYVCERTNGLGLRLMEQIWAAKGEDWREVTADDVKGLTAKKLNAFREMIEVLTREGEKSNVISWLMSKQASVNMATAAWEAWGTATVGIVTSNPYKLADLPHYGFTHVDGIISEAFGIKADDPRRIKACVLYCINLYTAGGDTVVSWPDLRDLCIKNTGGMYGNLISSCVTDMFEDGSLRGFKGSQNICLGDDFNNAKVIWEFCNEIG